MKGTAPKPATAAPISANIISHGEGVHMLTQWFPSSAFPKQIEPPETNKQNHKQLVEGEAFVFPDLTVTAKNNHHSLTITHEENYVFILRPPQC